MLKSPHILVAVSKLYSCQLFNHFPDSLCNITKFQRLHFQDCFKKQGFYRLTDTYLHTECFLPSHFCNPKLHVYTVTEEKH